MTRERRGEPNPHAHPTTGQGAKIANAQAPTTNTHPAQVGCRSAQARRADMASAGTMPVARGTRAGGTLEHRPGAIGDRSIRAGTLLHAQRPKTKRSRAGNGTAAQGTETLLADTTIRASRMIGERAVGKVPGLPPPGQSGMAIGKKHWRDKIKAHTDGQDTSRTVSNLVDKQKMKKAGQDRDAAEDPSHPIARA